MCQEKRACSQMPTTPGWGSVQESSFRQCVPDMVATRVPPARRLGLGPCLSACLCSQTGLTRPWPKHPPGLTQLWTLREEKQREGPSLVLPAPLTLLSCGSFPRSDSAGLMRSTRVPFDGSITPEMPTCPPRLLLKKKKTPTRVYSCSNMAAHHLGHFWVRTPTPRAPRSRA